jgi:polyisoprenoid-binding protein YceI
MAETPTLEALLQNASLAGEWVLDGKRSKVILRTRHTWGLLPLTGVFGEVSGQGAVSEAGVASGALTVAAASVETKNPKRDKHLRSADFFDVEKFPGITFVARKVEAEAGGITVTGDLTVRGTTRTITFPASVQAVSDNEVTIDAEIPVHRKDYGLNWNFIGIASFNNVIAVHAVFTKVANGTGSK